MDEKTKELLATYRKEVEQLARKVYLQAKSINREIEESKINLEDQETIRFHVTQLISNKKETPKN